MLSRIPSTLGQKVKLALAEYGNVAIAILGSYQQDGIIWSD
jgi:hypothetical protein